ncbi:putative SERF-like protein [Ctenocephalides felis]|uniref:putative SERF-like protein n=1 Tax=Ctenocephalides felis TaxID=7515 RepID=UPI000E6E1515|nr:putative SERF-like protein [Ctenocephalides felis]
MKSTLHDLSRICIIVNVDVYSKIKGHVSEESRDLARAKNQKKQTDLAKKKSSTDKKGMTFEQRKHRDAELMREKQRKNEQEDAAASGNS